jgi:hypothetical protein
MLRVQDSTRRLRVLSCLSLLGLLNDLKLWSLLSMLRLLKRLVLGLDWRLQHRTLQMLGRLQLSIWSCCLDPLVWLLLMSRPAGSLYVGMLLLSQWRRCY